MSYGSPALRRLHDEEARRQAMAAEVRAGLTASPRFIPCKYFYDDQGSALFERITELPEYYLTRTEQRILDAVADSVAGRTRPHELVELGSGASRKVRTLLDAFSRQGVLRRCLLLDIDEGGLAASLRSLAADYPRLEIAGMAADFLDDLPAIGPGGGRLIAFLGSTLGNVHPEEVPAFLRRVAAALAPGDAFLLGLDLVKDPGRLHAAYNDAAGVTAAFNRNILCVVNRSLGADFDPRAFDHVAFYDERAAWIEMRLRARKRMRVRIPAARLELVFAAGDEIRTEISCKYTRPMLEARCARTGLRIEDWFVDPEELFAVTLLRREGRRG